MSPLNHVLIVDDNENDLKKMGQIFESQGVDVAYAKNGKEAASWLEKIGNKKLDLIISEILMPEMNGIELSQHIGGNYPLILVSDEGEFPLLTDEYLDLVQAFIEKKDCEEILFKAAIKAVERWSNFGAKVSVAA